MDAPLDRGFRQKWDDRLKAFKVYREEFKKQANYVENLIIQLGAQHEDYIQLLVNVGTSQQDDYLEHFSTSYFKALLCVFDQVIFLQTGRVFRSYFNVNICHISTSKKNYFNNDYSASKEKIDLSILSKDGYCYEAERFVADLKRDCKNLKVEVI